MSDNINLLVTYTIKGNKRQEFLAAVNQIDLVRKTRKETGNKEYRYLHQHVDGKFQNNLSIPPFLPAVAIKTAVFF